MTVNGARSCAVTGAGGYLGSRLSAALRADGWNVYQLSRGAAGESVHFSLTDGAPPEFFRQQRVSVLVHCAWDFSLTRRSDIFAQNVEGSIRLMRQAHTEGVETIIFISTISAFDGCRSLYGMAKLAVEEEAYRLGAVIVRPGLVYGEKAGGIVGAMTNAVRRLPAVPMIGNGRQTLYPAHEDDVAQLVCQLATRPTGTAPKEPVIAASDRGWTLREILTSVAAAHGRRARIVPIPWRAIWLLLKAAETCGLRPAFRSDSVISIVNQDPSPNFAAAKAVGMPFRDFVPQQVVT